MISVKLGYGTSHYTGTQPQTVVAHVVIAGRGQPKGHEGNLVRQMQV